MNSKLAALQIEVQSLGKVLDGTIVNYHQSRHALDIQRKAVDEAKRHVEETRLELSQKMTELGVELEKEQRKQALATPLRN